MVKSGAESLKVDGTRKWVNQMIGEYSLAIDDKGRVRIPKDFRDELGETFYVTKGFDKSLFVFSKEEWEKFEDKLSSNQMKSANHRKVFRFFIGSANKCVLDGQGRVTLNQSLREYSELLKDVMVVGMHRRVEIWSKENWQAYQEDIGDIAFITEGLDDLNL